MTSDSNKYANVDYRLKNLTNALYLTANNDVAVRTGVEAFSYGDTGQLSPFGRLRITDATTINNYKTIYPIQTGNNDFNNSANGAATISFVPNSACYNMTVSTSNGEYAIRQSKEYHSYKPGCGQVALVTGTLAATKNNLTQRVGYYDDYNGIFFEHANNNVGTTTLSWNIRSTVGNTTSISETATSANWNIDKFDGTGPSGLTLDFTKSQIFVMDFQWLGVGRVRCGFDIDGIMYYAHEFLHANRTAGVFMSTPSLPIRWEIRNTGVTSGSSTLAAICAAVQSEGGTEEESWTFNCTTGNTGVTCSTTDKGVIAFRLKGNVQNQMNRVTARLSGYNMFASQSCFFTVYHLANAAQISGTPVWSNVSTNSSHCEFTTNFNLIGGYVANSLPINGGFISTAQGSANGSNQTLITSKKARIYQNYDSTDSEIIAIVAQRIGNQDSVIYASFDITEIV